MTIRWHRGALDTATAFLAALVAGLSLMVPIDFAWTSTTSAVRVDLLVVSLPRAIAHAARWSPSSRPSCPTRWAVSSCAGGGRWAG